MLRADRCAKEVTCVGAKKKKLAIRREQSENDGLFFPKKLRIAPLLREVFTQGVFTYLSRLPNKARYAARAELVASLDPRANACEIGY